MDGSSASLIIIPIVATISLAIWLIAVYHADCHCSALKASRPAPGPADVIHRPGQDLTGESR